MKKVIFVVEKTSDGFSAYALEDGIAVGTSADTIADLKSNIVDAYNSYADIEGKKEVGLDDIQIQLDVPQFFDYYKIINASALGARIGIDKTLISQYVNGHKIPGPKQIKKILDGIKKLGQELSTLELT